MSLPAAKHFGYINFEYSCGSYDQIAQLYSDRVSYKKVTSSDHVLLHNFFALKRPLFG